MASNGRWRPQDFSAQPALRELGSIAFGMPLPRHGPIIQMRQLHAQHRRLYRIQSAVETHEVVIVAWLLPVVSQHLQLRRKLAIIRRDESPIAKAAQVFRRVE